MKRKISERERLLAIDLWKSGKSCKIIHAELGFSLRACQYLVKHWELKGEVRVSQYGNCGLHNQKKRAIKEHALELKASHHSWGAGLIRCKLSALYAASDLPSERTLSAWFKKKDST